MNVIKTASMFFSLVFWFSSSGQAVTVSSVSALEAAVTAANGGGDKQIKISGGTYNLGGVYLRITADNVSVSGATGKRGDVVLDGNYQTTEIIQVLGSNVTIQDMTLKRAVYHPIHIFPDDHDVVGTLITNVHIIDPGQQAIKINQNGAKTHSANYGTIQNSKIELTDSGRAKVWEFNGSCYTGGVDTHHGKAWNICDNVITGFWCAGGLSEHGIHFWSFSEDTVVERNQIINCDRGIGFGLGSSGHVGGIIRNNMIYHNTGHAYSDVGIGLESAPSAQVYNNTIFHEHDYPYAIEYRFQATSNVVIRNNLTNKTIISRNGGTGTLSNNVTSAQSSWFANAEGGDLHLGSSVAGVVDSGISVSGLLDDFDKEARPIGSGVDIGADEWSASGGSKSPALSWMLLLIKK